MSLSGTCTVSLPVDKDWIEETILKRHPSSAKLLSIGEPKRIDEGQGFLSFIIRVELTWSIQTNGLPHSVIFKIFTANKVKQELDNINVSEELMKEMNESDNTFNMMHQNECSLYDFIKGRHASFPVPVCYYTQPSAIAKEPLMLVIEDFSSRGACVNMLDGLTLEQVYAVAEAIAEYQAYFLKHTGWEDQFRIWDKEEMKSFNATMGYMYDKLYELAPGELENLTREQVCQLASYSSEWDMLFYYEGNRVLCHGDIHAHNMIFERKEGKLGDQLLALFDWQLAHAGNPGEDLSRLLVLSVDGDVRRECQMDVLKAYYRRLQKILDGKAPFTLDEVEAWYWRSMRYQALHALMLVPLLVPKAQYSQDVINRATRRGVYAVQDTLKNAIWDLK